jgi:hypothetical protein
MLLPDNIHPELTIYYNGSLVLKELKAEPEQSIIDLYQKVKSKNGMSFMTLMLCLDWLYLINVAKINDNGRVEQCS